MNDAQQTGALGAIELVVGSVSDPTDLAQVRAAVLSVSPGLVDDVIFGAAAPELGAAADGELLGVGTPVSPGFGVGVVVGSSEAALDLFDREIDFVLTVDETGPADEPAMRVADAIVTRGGGVSSHAAIVARQWGIPAVCGVADLAVEPGTTVLVDGSTGEVRRLDRSLVPVEAAGPLSELPPALATLLGWADEIAAGSLSVLANADLAADGRLARTLGAQGVGLCRTEHQFLGERRHLLGRVISGDDASVVEMREVLRTAFGALLGAMEGLGVTVRLFDAPLHEFLDDHGEHNPMLGLRGVRLGLTHPHVLTAQIEALCEAIVDQQVAVRVGVLVPMVALSGELAAARTIIDAAVQRVSADRGSAIELAVGTMIETPRAALSANGLAGLSDFFSFGTNDLTQLSWGLSRDDLDSTLLVKYRSMGLIDRSPFETLDGSGVVRLMALAAETGRAVNPGLGLSMCGEQGADPASMAIAVQLGLDSVSVSPFRVPAARLAAAHAVLAVGGIG